VAEALRENFNVNIVNIPTKINAGKTTIVVVSKTGEALTNPSLAIHAVVNP